MSSSAPPPTPPQAPRGWEDFAVRSTAILAVLAALSSGQWGASNLKAILEQGKVNDGWAYYQSKSVKAHLAEANAQLAAALAKDLGALGGAGELAKYQAARMAEHERLEGEKEKSRRDAETAENKRDDVVERSFWFELAFISLQVGVVLSTVAAAAKKKGLWVVALLTGVLGFALVANGFLRVVKTPAYAKKLAIDLTPKVGAKPGAAKTETPPAESPKPDEPKSE